MLRVPVETFFEVQRINFLLQALRRIGTLLAFSVKKITSRKFCTKKSHGKSQKRSGPRLDKKKMKKLETSFFRIEKRGLNLMRSMQQGISTHYNTRFGI